MILYYVGFGGLNMTTNNFMCIYMMRCTRGEEKDMICWYYLLLSSASYFCEYSLVVWLFCLYLPKNNCLFCWCCIYQLLITVLFACILPKIQTFEIVFLSIIKQLKKINFSIIHYIFSSKILGNSNKILRYSNLKKIRYCQILDRTV